MLNITSEVPLGSSTIAATGGTPTRVDSASTSTRRTGVRLCNQSDTKTAYILPQSAGVTAPTAGDLTSSTGAIFMVPPGGTLTGGWGTGIAIYAVGDTSFDLEITEIISDSPVETSLIFPARGDAILATATNDAQNRIYVSGVCTPVRLAATGQVSSGTCRLCGYYVNVAGAGIGEIYDNPSAATGDNPICIAAAVGMVEFPQPIPMVDGVWAVLTAGHNVTFFTEPS